MTRDLTLAGALPPPRGRSPRRRLVLVAVFALAACILLWLAVFSAIRTERSQEIQAVNRENDNLARAFEEHVRRTIRYADQIALQVKRFAEASGSDAQWNQITAQTGPRDEAIKLIGIFDVDGNLRRTNLSFESINIADREHFRVHLERDGGELFVGKPILARQSRAWTIPLSRRINRPDGSFGGTITVGISTAYFSNFYQRLDLGQSGLVSLVGKDGIVRARQSGDNKAPGQDLSGAPLMQLAAARTEGTFRTDGRIDGTERLASFRVIPDLPLVVVVGRGLQEALAPVTTRATTYLQMAAAVTLLLLAFIAALARSMVRDDRALRQAALLRAEGDRAFQELEARESRYRRLIEDMPEAIVTTQGGRVQLVNRAALRLTGAACLDVLAGRSVLDFVDPQSHAECIAKTTALNREETHLPHWELRMRRIEGTTFDAEFSSVSFPVDGKLVVQHIFRDVSARKQSEFAAQQSNAELERRVAERTAQLEAANRELETFSYSVSHDLRAPLRAINGFTRILEEHAGDRLDTEGRRLLGRIASGALRMNILIDSLLEFARAGRAELRRSLADTAEIAASAVAEVRLAYPEAEVSIGDLPSMRADADLLREVMVNLVDNAFKYSSKSSNPKVEIGHLPDAQGGTIFVRDNGAGFDPARTQDLYEPFRRLHSDAEFPGTGIGLALCKRIIERHSGRLWAQSSPGKGATFFFHLARE